MKIDRRILMTGFIAALITACGGASSGGNGLTVEQLKNTTYYLVDAPNGQITLKNGQGEEPIAPGSASKYTAMFIEDPAAFGDLNKDNASDAADIIVTSGGGSGSFYHLAALLNQNGQPKNVAATLLGDRIKVNSLKIENSIITVEYLDRGPNDPMTVEPTQKTTKSYKLDGPQLIEVPQ